MVDDSDPQQTHAVSTHGAVPVGRVLGTQAATPLSFWVGLEPGRIVQLDDVAATWRDVPGRGRVLVAGVVTEVRAGHEGARSIRTCSSSPPRVSHRVDYHLYEDEDETEWRIRVWDIHATGYDRISTVPRTVTASQLPARNDG